MRIASPHVLPVGEHPNQLMSLQATIVTPLRHALGAMFETPESHSSAMAFEFMENNGTTFAHPYARPCLLKAA